MDERKDLIELINRLSDKELTAGLTGGEAAELDIAQRRLGAMVMRELAEKNLKKQEARKARKKVDKRWKRGEDEWWKRVQHRPNAKREGHIKRGVSCKDMRFDFYSLDVTTRKKPLPKWITREIEDARFHAGTEMPIVAIHVEGEPMRDGIVIMRAGDFWDAYL